MIDVRWILTRKIYYKKRQLARMQGRLMVLEACRNAWSEALVLIRERDAAQAAERRA